ncbi:alpha/beta hydrolase [Actinokineospora sp. PR83]|uniref:alpha/beta hydrolase n=1 Tax=Actinokineospora sp. PR83 TaxID=2884908 RepID=UPI001F3C0B66|nr:alpha/beta hydrolase [Actinokineospora sp. PR83]MCG8914493.1 alpha/beta hydrolase [Actinokineospora sp. PR83]
MRRFEQGQEGPLQFGPVARRDPRQSAVELGRERCQCAVPRRLHLGEHEELLRLKTECGRLVADLHLPGDIDASAPLRAVVLSTPGSSVKEQIGANHASRLAARGIAALVFDPARSTPWPTRASKRPAAVS